MSLLFVFILSVSLHHSHGRHFPSDITPGVGSSNVFLQIASSTEKTMDSENLPGFKFQGHATRNQLSGGSILLLI